jgi:dUTP pyrophosphatase
MSNINPRVKFIQLHPNAKIPTRANKTDSGLDLYAVEDFALLPGHRTLAKTGLAMALPHGYEGQVRPRSGLAIKNGVTVLNAPGTIDEDYRGEICVILINHSTETFRVKVGDRIAQLVIAKVAILQPIEVESLDDTERGEGGFGSSGR